MSDLLIKAEELGVNADVYDSAEQLLGAVEKAGRWHMLYKAWLEVLTCDMDTRRTLLDLLDENMQAAGTGVSWLK